MSDIQPGLIIAIVGSKGVSPTNEQVDAALVELLAELGRAGPESRPAPVPQLITEVICAGQPGDGRCGESWAQERGIPVHYEPATGADAARWGRYLGPKMRNIRIAERAHAALAFWDGKSELTPDFVARMNVRKKPCVVVPCRATKSGRRRTDGSQAANARAERAAA